MMGNNRIKIITILSCFLTVVLAIVSFCGLFIKGIYKHDSASMAVQALGQDFVDLFIIVPLLIVALIFMLKNNRAATVIFGGTVFYIIYTFVVYCFGVYFNKLFLLYCIELGLAFYTFFIYVNELNKKDIQNWYGDRIPVRLVSAFLIIISGLFYLLWMKEIITALVNNSVPKSVGDYNLLVNPVHVLDISIVLPGVIISSIFLLKRQCIGYILAPLALIFVTLTAIALTGMAIMLKVKNISDDISIVIVFIILAVISSFFLFILLRNISYESNQ